MELDLFAVKEEHELFNEIVDVKEILDQRERDVKAMTRSLQRAERMLQDLLNTSHETVQSIRQAQESPVNLEDLVTRSYPIRINV